MGELFRYRSLMWALVIRHLRSRYRGSVLGFLWTLLNPLCLMIVYTVVFRFYMRAGTDEFYSIFLFAGLLPWLWTASTLHEGTASIVSSGHLITKSMFPAHLLPVVAVMTNFLNFLLSLPLLFIFMIAAGKPLYLELFALPLVMIVHFVFLQGLAIGLSALNVHFRDVQHLVGNLLTFLFFLCPIVYSPDLVPANFQWTLVVNPFALLTLVYHGIILNGEIPLQHIAALLGFALISLLLGNMIFERYRETFAESL